MIFMPTMIDVSKTLAESAPMTCLSVKPPNSVGAVGRSTRGAASPIQNDECTTVGVDPDAVFVPRKIAEAIQGVDRHSRPFFVGVTATGSPRQPTFRFNTGVPFGVSRVQKSKVPTETSATVASRFLEDNGISQSQAGAVTISSLLKAGGGEASSSSDSTGTISRYAQAYGIPLPLSDLYERLCAVERSDLLLCPEFLVRCYPEAGRFEILRDMYPGLAMRWDTAPDKAVPTVGARSMDQRRRLYGATYESLVNLAIQCVEGFCNAATASACMNDNLLPKPGLSTACRLAADHGCAVLCSHTGTFLALWIPAVKGRLNFELAGHLREQIASELSVSEVEWFLTGGINT